MPDSLEESSELVAPHAASDLLALREIARLLGRADHKRRGDSRRVDGTRCNAMAVKTNTECDDDVEDDEGAARAGDSTRGRGGAAMNAVQASRRRLLVNRVERIRRDRSVILGYHGVSEAPVSQDLHLLLITPARFRAQLELLLEAGFEFVTVAELAALADGGEPPPGYAAVSFDDGMRNNLTIALPILRELGIRASVYVVIDFIGGRSPWTGPDSDNRMMTEAELRELAAEGWELGAHTVTHCDLSRLGYEDCLREITQSKTALEAIVQRSVQTLAYPFGRFGAAAVAASRDSGMIAAVSAGQGSWAPYEMRRAMIGALDPMPIVLLKLANSYEPVLGLPPIRLLRDASKRVRRQLQVVLWRRT